MAVGDLRSLPCPCCGARHDLAVWLDTPGRTWRGGRRVEVRCESCSEPLEIDLQEHGVAIGPVGRAHDPLQRPALRIDQPGLAVRADPAGLQVTLGHRQWFLPRPPRETAPGL